MSSEERKKVARTLVGLRFPIDNPERVIRAALDEPVEQVATADFYNGSAAEWVRRQTPFQWLPLDHSELDVVRTVRDLGKICYAHLIEPPPALELLPDDVLDTEAGDA